MEVTKLIFDYLSETLKDQGITLNTLSSLTQIPKTTLYRHFEKKEQLTIGELEAICAALKVKFPIIASTPDEVRLLAAYRSNKPEIQASTLTLLEHTK